MQKNLAGLVLVAGFGAALLLQGCKRHTAPQPVQPVVRLPKVQQPDVVGPLPIEGPDQNAVAKPLPPRRHPAEQTQSRPATNPQPEPSAAAIQQQRDARLLHQQQKASQAQQRELNQEVHKYVDIQQQIQAEPRIQDAPEPPASSGLGPDAPRIQDAPGPDQGQPGQTPPRIQDAPGPEQTEPQTQPQMFF